MHDSNNKNLCASSLHIFQQAQTAQLVEDLGLDPEARVQILVEANFLNK